MNFVERMDEALSKPQPDTAVNDESVTLLNNYKEMFVLIKED